MGENTQEKNLVEKKESFFGKVKNFFKKIFNKKETNLLYAIGWSPSEILNISFTDYFFSAAFLSFLMFIS